MTKKTPFLTELSLGLVLSGFMAWAYVTKYPFVETASLKSYDLFSKYRKSSAKMDSIQIVEIDDPSVASLGRWPWPRALTAQLVDEVAAGGAKVIGLNVLLGESDQNQGLDELSQLYEEFTKIVAKYRPQMRTKKISEKSLEEFRTKMEETITNLNGDSTLNQTIEQAKNVVLPMYFQLGDALGNNLEPLPAFFDKEKLNLPAGEAAPDVPPGSAAVLPLQEFGESSIATGHSNLTTDTDGTLRRIAPVMRYGTNYYPSFALELVRQYLNLTWNDFTWDKNQGFALSKAKIPTDEDAKIYLEYAGPAGTFKGISALDVLSGGAPEKSFTGKIVLIGVTAPGLADTFVVPGGERLTGLEIWATHIENILNQRFIVRPPWASKAEWATIALAAFIVVLVLPLMRAKFSIPVAALAFAGLLAGCGFLFVKQGIWVSPAYGMVLLGAGFAVLVGKRLVFTERGKEMVEAEGVETNKMLGLSFQGQGMLDLAFEKFRRCPLDDAMKELLYNLGLDMERKRQFAKAAAVYEHIFAKEPKYKDVREKIDFLKKAGEGAVFGGLGKKGNESTVVVEGLGQSTTLGRYEVTKELGRGAMGIVYLGRDPKINRQVAIKTLRFEDEMDEAQAKSTKERFFREAESAGSLTHPNIIRIFDAGEDQEVAYIAMELLEGEDLKRFCEKANLLPMAKVVDLIIHVASGLDYAHKQGVVHRDIKPGNIMLLKDGTLRITDFGIARIQASSKTATGAVLGTPAYMSPEQVNGKKADGRADIFSLGVTFFEMLTGEKPFYADSIAALLYRIANVDHPNPREYNASIPNDIVAVINKALAKDPEQRYQTAGEMAADLQECLKHLDGAGAPASAPKPAAPVVAAKPATPPPAVVAVPPATPPAAAKPAAPAADGRKSGPSPQETLNELAHQMEKALQTENNTMDDQTPGPEQTLKIERTVTIDPASARGIEIPMNPAIDHGFQPEIPGDSPEKK